MATSLPAEGRIATRYWLAIFVTLGALLLVTGAVETYLGYQDNLRRATEIQWVVARASAQEITSYLDRIERQIEDAANVASALTDGSIPDAEAEFQRLLKLTPEVFRVRVALRKEGLEFVISRTDRDEVRALAPAEGTRLIPAGTSVLYGEVFAGPGDETFVTVTVGSQDANVIAAADLNLTFASETIRSNTRDSPFVTYITDRKGLLVAHTSVSAALRRSSTADLPQFIQVNQAIGRGGAPFAMTGWGRRLDDAAAVLSTATYLPKPQWIVFSELARSEALAPAIGSMWRSLLVVGVGLVLSLVVAKMFASSLTLPIRSLRTATRRIIAGELNSQISIKTGDEVELLAADFNAMSASLRRSYEDLESKVTIRTSELTRANDVVRAQAEEVQTLNDELQARVRQLEVLKQEADRASAAKTRFLAAASHDLRQPMHAIGLLVGVLAQRQQSAAEQHLIGRIQMSVDAMERLFSSLLDISKLDAGVVRATVQEFPLDPLLRVLEFNFGEIAKAKGLGLDVPSTNINVRSDPALLERILTNLVANAVRYTERGKVVVKVRFRGDHVKVLIVDSGIGIPKESYSEIFEEFVQLRNPERDRNKGLGLGLSIVKRTAGILGHPLALSSRIGKGSVFCVTVPALAATAVVTVLTSRTSCADALERAFVVVIEDDYESRYAVGALLEQSGCHTVLAANCDDALSQLEAHLRTPDLIISDLRLPGNRTGIQAVEVVRQTLGVTVAAIVVTGDLHSEALTLPVRCTLLHKPVTAEDLRLTCVSMLASTIS